MASSGSLIFDCQANLAALLTAEARPAALPAGAPWPPVFADPAPNKSVTVFTQRKGNLQVAVQQALTKLGAGVIVMLPLAKFTGENERVSLRLMFAVVVTEQPVTNQTAAGTGKPAEMICERIVRILQWTPNGVALNPNANPGRFQIDKNAISQMPPVPGAMTLLNYTVAVNTEINL